MLKEIRLPQLGQTMEEGTIVDFRVKVGDQVNKGDVVFEVETDKATLEVESPSGGFVRVILKRTGDTIPVNVPVIILGDKDEDIPRSFIDSLMGAASSVPAQTAAASDKSPAPQPAPQAESSGKIMASPRARKLAAELGVDLAGVAGSGPGGKIDEEDVRAAAHASAPAGGPESGSAVPLSRMQKITGAKMQQSKRDIPCYYLTVRVDMTDLVALRMKMNQSGGEKISYNDFLIAATARALRKFPIMTGQLSGDSIRLADKINVALAISVGEDLVAPVLKDVCEKSIPSIVADRAALVERTQAGKLAPRDLDGGCITISNLGGFGIDSFIPIVVPGQCSIMGIGRIADTCVPDGDNGPVVTRKLMNITLSVDHKIANGAYAAQFLDHLRKLLEDPATFQES